MWTVTLPREEQSESFITIKNVGSASEGRINKPCPGGNSPWLAAFNPPAPVGCPGPALGVQRRHAGPVDALSYRLVY